MDVLLGYSDCKEEINIKVYPFMSIEKLPKHPVYSSFTMLCAHICFYYLPKRRLKIGIPVNEVTVSAITKHPYFLDISAISFASLLTPVDVSA